jgi:Uncharacterized conserved protein (DUF2358)
MRVHLVQGLVALLVAENALSFTIDNVHPTRQLGTKGSAQLMRSNTMLCSQQTDSASDTATSTSSNPPTASTSQSYSYEAKDSSQGLVSFLTNLVNALSPTRTAQSSSATAMSDSTVLIPPTTPTELLQRIQADYTVNNYLWTGDIDLACYSPDCKFTDPTLSFVGRDVFVKNIQNLKPIVDRIVPQGQCSSVLLASSLQDGYVQTRWNMKGRLAGLPWKPCIDVIGRTKFRYKQVAGNQTNRETGVQVYSYDEEWEMPAYKALLQLIQPGKSVE